MLRSRRFVPLTVTALVFVLWTAACKGSAQPTAAQPKASGAAAPSDPLPSWNDGVRKRSIVDFVNRVTREGGPDFVPPPERLATFDNDGQLWSEKPVPFQLVFAFDREPPPPASRLEDRTVRLTPQGDMAGVAVSGGRVCRHHGRDAHRNDH